MEDDWNRLTHRVDSRQNGFHSECDFRYESCYFHPKGMRLIERKKLVVWTYLKIVLPSLKKGIEISL